MGETGFYHLTRSRPSHALARLLGRTLRDGRRAVVLAPDAAAVVTLDDALWAEPEPDWLPHGAGDAADPLTRRQPVWITADAAALADPPNGAAFLFLVAGAGTGTGDGTAYRARYDRVFDLFDGRDEEAVAAARRRWLEIGREGGARTYWRETASGWEAG